MIRAIVINSIERTIREVQLPQDGEGDVPYDVMRAAVFPAGDLGLIEIVNLGGNTQMVIDEEGLLRNWDEQGFFTLGPGQNKATFAGVGLLIGYHPATGAAADLPLPLALIEASCRWMDAREVSVPAPSITTFGSDGTATTEPLCGRESWDYQNRP